MPPTPRPRLAARPRRAGPGRNVRLSCPRVCLFAALPSWGQTLGPRTNTRSLASPHWPRPALALLPPTTNALSAATMIQKGSLSGRSPGPASSSSSSARTSEAGGRPRGWHGKLL